jgi:hypothetical protein
LIKIHDVLRWYAYLQQTRDSAYGALGNPKKPDDPPSKSLRETEIEMDVARQQRNAFANIVEKYKNEQRPTENVCICYC